MIKREGPVDAVLVHGFTVTKGGDVAPRDPGSVSIDRLLTSDRIDELMRSGGPTMQIGATTRYPDPHKPPTPDWGFAHVTVTVGSTVYQTNVWAYGTAGDDPVPLMSFRDEGQPEYWLFRRVVYSTRREDLSALDVKALILESENKVRLRLARARFALEAAEALEHSSKARRVPLPDDVKVFVWNRDGGRCVRCASDRNLEFDHIIPVSMGGSSTARNLQLLCESCNRQKGGNLL